MALDAEGRWGPKTADDLHAYCQATFPPDRLTFITVNEMREVWKLITKDAQDEFRDNADVLPVAHTGDNLNNPEGQELAVPALGLLDSHGLPCTGEADTGTTSAPQDIVGKGSIT
jgi:hypothetical protein